MQYTNLIARAFNKPVLLHSGYASTLYAYLSSRVGFAQLTNFDGSTLDNAGCVSLAAAYKASAATGT